MKVLFFLEPAIEFSNPLFRYATLRNVIIPQIQALEAFGHQCYLITSEPIAEQALRDGISSRIPAIHPIDPVEWTDCENYLSRSLRHLGNQMSVNEYAKTADIIKNALPKDFYPDLIVVWESPANFFKSIYPDIPVMFQQPGLFSRAPFPNLISFDKGLLWEVTPPQPISAPQETKNQLNILRHKTQALMNLEPKSIEFINRMRRKFSSLILFPLQVDGYFTVDGCLQNRMSQVEVLISLLEDLPQDVGLIVTRYRSKDIQTAGLTNAIVDFLNFRYKNFIFEKSIDTLPNASQLLTPLVDGVISISSSIGYQAALWKKPLMVCGRSQLEFYKTAMDLSELIEQAGQRTEFCRDLELLDTLSTRNFPVSAIGSDSYINTMVSFSTHGAPPASSAVSINYKWEEEFCESQFLSQIGILEYQKSTISREHTSELSMQILRYDVISFDIFDTLVNRPFMQPADLFDFMARQAESIINRQEIDFRLERKIAERAAFENAVANGRGEIKISEIYELLRRKLKLTKKKSNQLMELEKSLEVKLMSQRESGYRAFQLAKALGKRIILVSDMYLPREVIENILDKCGYNEFEKLYLSSEVGMKKHSGKLYDYVLSDLNILPSTVLHIGDNLVGDVQRSKSRGIKPFHLVHSLERFKSTSSYILPWQRDEDRHSLDWQIILACVGHKFCNNPYLPERKGTLFGGDPWRLGYYGMGPLLLAYVKWLLHSATRDGIERLYFLSRDGLVIKRAYDLLASCYPNAPKSTYLYCSRRSVNLAKASNSKHLMDLIDVDYSHKMRLVDLLQNRFGLEINADILKTLAESGWNQESRITSNDRPEIKKLISLLSPHILKVANDERKHYLKYLADTGIYGAGKVAIVDIGYAGTMQESLFILSEEKKSIDGYYLITFRQALSRIEKKGLKASGFLANFIDRHDTHHPFCKHVPLYETLFSASETSFIRMHTSWDGTTRPVFAPVTSGEARRKEVVNNIQTGAIDFVDEFLSLFGDLEAFVDVEPNKTIRVLDEYFSSPHPVDAKILVNVGFEDMYGGCNKSIILPLNAKNEAESIWASGRDALIRDATNSKKNQKVNIKWIYKIEKFALSKLISEKKLQKYYRNREKFFRDSNSIYVQLWGRHF